MKKIRPLILFLVVAGIAYMSWSKYQGTKVPLFWHPWKPM